MRSLAYLMALKAKNRIIEILKKPSQLIFLLMVAGLIVFTAVSAEYSYSEEYRDINELYSIVFALYSFIFITTSKNGFHSGASMFSMADVNLLFVSPIKSGSLLSFGLLGQMGRSLMISVFILYQSSTVRMHYDVGFSALVYILIGYAITVFLSQMLAMLIYSITSSDEKKQIVGKVIFYGIVGAFAIALLGITFMRDNSLSLLGLSKTLEGSLFSFFPVSGIATLFAKGAIGGEISKILIGIFGAITMTSLFYFIVSRMNTDYYEDVLAATEVSFSAINARKEGKAAENAPRNVKTGKIGINKGFGASVIAEKHRIENRRGKVFILSPMSLVLVAVSAVMAIMFKDEPIAIFAANVYILVFSVANSRWVKELNYPYVYLIPESAAKKMWYMIKGEIPSLALESLICFLPVYLITNSGITETAAMVLARIAFGLLITGVNLVLQRIFGSSDKKFLAIIVYMFGVMILSLPGVFAAFAVGNIFPFYQELSYLAMALVNILIAAVLIYGGRNVLEYAESNNK